MISDRLWDEAESRGPSLIARRYEAAWRTGNGIGSRPRLNDFLPPEPAAETAALLALLRADLSLRREEGERVRIEEYLEQFPGMAQDVLVALVYEEYCLREEAGEAPDLAEYEERFPDVAGDLRQVLEIHSLVRSGKSAMPVPEFPESPPFPQSGQTIAGFRLVEELGRGAFARVFRAEERPLADRSVALKVTRTASREPQALARLQHTHIVPVHSYRTDPVTGFHLLCMPYLGRVTLADLLTHCQARTVRSGNALVNALDELRAADDALADRPAGRTELARRSHSRAIAWWGARLAEALQHAHDRGILHRDIKPSNVLITGDGLPMLLDFNLAQESWVEDPAAAPSALGGTLAYMAPEQLEALADGTSDHVDGRADIFALGVVLFETLADGTRPFSLPKESLSLPEFLRRVAEERRTAAPRLRAERTDVPRELEVVVDRCLAPDPSSRYATASELAADLQAVADDAPLRFAHEPLANRIYRWQRRHRRRLAMALPAVLIMVLLASNLVSAKFRQVRLEGELVPLIAEGERALRDDQLDAALEKLGRAIQLASEDERFALLKRRGASLREQAERAKEARSRADEFFRVADRSRFVQLGFGEPEPSLPTLESILQLFSIEDDENWTDRDDVRLLDPSRRARLQGEAEDLLFFSIVALDRGRTLSPELKRRAGEICTIARRFVPNSGPWAAIRSRYDDSAKRPLPVSPQNEPSGRACFYWGLLCRLENQFDASIEWLERAVQLRPNDYWSQFCLANRYEQAGRVQRAIEHYSIAIALYPDVPWALFNRAKLFHQQESWSQARADLDSALAKAHGDELLEARLESGTLRERIGDVTGARADYETVVRSRPKSSLAYAARLNLAKLDLLGGEIARARAAFDALLAVESRDTAARRYRALLSLRIGSADQAEADLSIMIPLAIKNDNFRETAELHAYRAMARLALGRPEDAVSDAAVALQLQQTPSHERLWYRALLASGRDRDLADLLLLDDPDEIDRLPVPGPSLVHDLRATIARLERLSSGDGPRAAAAQRTRAALIGSLSEPAALARACLGMANAPISAESAVVLARLRRRSGDLRAALRDVENGLAVSPGSPRLLLFKGQLLSELGQPLAALTQLDRAVLRGARGTVRAARARALMDLGQVEAALEAWSSALAYDSEDPYAYLGRARVFIRLRRWDHALADLEKAAEWSEGRSGLLARTTLVYATCLAERPSRLARVIGLARQTVAAWVAASRPISQAVPRAAVPRAIRNARGTGVVSQDHLDATR